MGETAPLWALSGLEKRNARPYQKEGLTVGSAVVIVKWQHKAMLYAGCVWEAFDLVLGGRGVEGLLRARNTVLFSVVMAVSP
jgi:hypothetical protein